MVIRVYATWNRSRPILILCICALCLNTGSYFGLFGVYYATMGFLEVPFLVGCQPGAIPFTKIYISLIFALVFETMIVILIGIKSYPILRQRAFRSSFYAVLFEDGLAYYCLVVLAHAITLISMFNINAITIPILGSSFAFPLIGIAVHRIILRSQLIRNEPEIPTSLVSTNIVATRNTVPAMKADSDDFSDEEMELRNRGGNGYRI